MGLFALRRNDVVVRNAFKRLEASKDAAIESGMVRLLGDAVQYAISIHDHEHFGHRITGDSYGWALLHNRTIKQMQVNGGRHGQGDAEDQLREVARGVTKDGWVGIILSSMLMAFGNRKPIYFEVDYEMGILDMTQDEIRDHFTEYFKPITK